MWQRSLDWLGFTGQDSGHAHGDGHSHGHSHGVLDASIASTTRGIWAVKWSFAILALTALFQVGIVILTGSVALFADTVHNMADALTAVPLWLAFSLARRKPSPRFPYGLGRAEDLAGIAIVLMILFSACVGGYEAWDRLLHPAPVNHLGWLIAAGLVSFAGNEAVAVFRIRIGRQINSAALIADGFHARSDGLTALAVIAGAVGVWLGYPLADPVVGLVITLTLLGIVWQSARAVLTRMLDGLEPGVLADLTHAAGHVAGVQILRTRARWLGHKLHAALDIRVAEGLSLDQATALATQLEAELRAHMPTLAEVTITFARPSKP